MAASASFEEFYAATVDRLHGQLFLVTGDLHVAEEIIQEAFTRASMRWSHLRDYDRPEAWVRRVAFNEARNGARRGTRRPCPPNASTCIAPWGGSPHRTARSWSSTTSPSCRWTRCQAAPAADRDRQEPSEPCPQSARRAACSSASRAPAR